MRLSAVKNCEYLLQIYNSEGLNEDKLIRIDKNKEKNLRIAKDPLFMNIKKFMTTKKMTKNEQLQDFIQTT